MLNVIYALPNAIAIAEIVFGQIAMQTRAVSANGS